LRSRLLKERGLLCFDRLVRRSLQHSRYIGHRLEPSRLRISCGFASCSRRKRSRFDAERNLIVVNNGHRDFVFATRSRALQLRYLVRLYVKELVLRNFAGLPAEQLAERMIELSLYVEEKLKST